MIRAYLATAIALVVAWTPSTTLVHARVDESQYRQPTTLVEKQHPPAPVAPFVLAPVPVPQAPLPVAEIARRTQSKLKLDVSAPPRPGPATVVTTRPLPRPATPEEILRGARISPPPESLRNASDLSCIAVAIYHEARNQEDFGQRAVASVILQRVQVPHRWGNRPCDTVIPIQFSFMTSRFAYPPINDRNAWQKAVRFAARALLEGPMPELKGADHYHTTTVSPEWAPAMVRIRKIDDHIFYLDPRSSFTL